jgi:DNA-binding NtrC family response regulator
MSPLAQVRLLRFLQEREYQRLGDTQPRAADVRVVSATNADLPELVRRGRFRKDLWFRLKDDLVTVPPLRERGDDVLLLARHFLRRFASARGACPPPVGAAAARALLRHPWPGNVRQLESEMQRLAVRVSGREVQVEDLSPEVRDSAAPDAPWGLRAVLRERETAIVREALERHGGVLARAAADLGITRQALWAKVRRLGLAGQDA